MNDLKKISEQLPSKTKMSKKDLQNTKGGRRWVTAVKAHADYYYKSLKDGGFSCSMSYHDGKYCIEW